MEQIRKPFQGITNIVRFNWHYYLFAFLFILFLLALAFYLNYPFNILVFAVICLVFFSTSISLIASFYIYDLAGIYNLSWITEDDSQKSKLIVNINAGFDETSYLLKEKFKNADLIVYDFYNPEKHTEISIERARKAYPPFPKTELIKTNSLPLKETSADLIFLIFAAHEIRDENERIIFFSELNRILKPDGKIYVVEHLRDFLNFSVYNIGFFHFLTKQNWLKVFDKSNFTVYQESKLTPFISVFILTKNGTST